MPELHFERIGKAIKKRRETRGIKAKDADLELAEAFGIRPLSARSYREYIEYGSIYGTNSYLGKTKHGQRNMNRLSFYLGFLGFDEADITVVRTKLIDRRFKYPLHESETNF
jgi:transcriptional regulator with XRE-family HTH domain